VKRNGLRGAALGVLLLYLALGPVLYSQGAARTKGSLPIASLSLQEIESRNGRALQVSQVAQNQPTAGRAPVARAAPERLLPDMQVFEPSDLHTVGSRAEGNLRLKFTTLIWNAGRGPLETRGAKNPQTGALEVYQFVYSPEGRARRGRRVGTFNYNHRHGHLHFDNFARYELWSLDADGKPAEVVAHNRKIGFCLMDIKHVASDRTHLQSGLMDQPGGPVYAGCREDVQGISVGWGDEYLSLLYEQDLELRGVPDGDYALVVTTNPEGTIEESSYDNNAATTYLTLAGETVARSSVERF